MKEEQGQDLSKSGLEGLASAMASTASPPQKRQKVEDASLKDIKNNYGVQSGGKRGTNQTLTATTGTTGMSCMPQCDARGAGEEARGWRLWAIH